MSDEDPLEGCEGFDSDDGNIDKNWKTHGILFWECEEIFLNEPLVVKEDIQHSFTEDRYYAFGEDEFRTASVCCIHCKEDFNPSYFCTKYDSKGKKNL